MDLYISVSVSGIASWVSGSVSWVSGAVVWIVFRVSGSVFRVDVPVEDLPFWSSGAL